VSLHQLATDFFRSFRRHYDHRFHCSPAIRIYEKGQHSNK